MIIAIPFQHLERYRHENLFHFFLWYPEAQRSNEWKQETNPVTKKEGGVEGYEVMNVERNVPLDIELNH